MPFAGGASEPSDTLLLEARSRSGEPSHPLSAGSPIRRRLLDRGSSATHQRSCGSGPRIRVVSTTAPPALPVRARHKRLHASHELTRPHLETADMRVDET